MDEPIQNRDREGAAEAESAPAASHPLPTGELSSDEQSREPDGAAAAGRAGAAIPTPAGLISEPPPSAPIDSSVPAGSDGQTVPAALDDQPGAGEPGLTQPGLPPEIDDELRAVIEAIVYVTEEPVTVAQIAAVVKRPEATVRKVLDDLAAACAAAGRGIMVREIAGGYKMATKPEHHEMLRAFAKSLKPPLKLSLAALETLATIAYKQPITAPEIMEIRGVQGAGVLKTLLDRKLIQTAGRKNVVGKPILYRTTREFLVQFGLKDLSELPTLKEFEELRRIAVAEPETDSEPAAAAETAGEAQYELPSEETSIQEQARGSEEPSHSPEARAAQGTESGAPAVANDEPQPSQFHEAEAPDPGGPAKPSPASPEDPVERGSDEPSQS